MIILFETTVFYDSDCLSCFLAVKECGILQKLFSKIIVPLVVAHEILNSGTPQHIRDNFNELINLEFVEVHEMELDSPEHNLFNDIKKNYEFMGDGEAAVIALTQKNGGVIASNNLKDVKDYVEDYDLNLITTAFILAIAYEKHIKTKEELDKIWTDMINNGRKRSLPRNISSFTQYYDELYPNDMLFMGLN